MKYTVISTAILAFSAVSALPMEEDSQPNPSTNTVTTTASTISTSTAPTSTLSLTQQLFLADT